MIEHPDVVGRENTGDNSPIRKKQNLLQLGLHWIAEHRKISAIAGALLFTALLAGIPYTRYALLGLFVKQSYSVVIIDSVTHSPVTDATVFLGGSNAKTDNKGEATVHESVGYKKLSVSKKYYRSMSRGVLVPLNKSTNPLRLELKATGRPTNITIINKISGKPVENMLISAAGTNAKTDRTGKAALVLPTNRNKVDVRLSGNGFNTSDSTIDLATKHHEHRFEITPSGKIYFLSNQSGMIDVISANLDGTARQTVLAGTGKEDKSNTILKVTADRKYLALLTRRDDDLPKLFLIETATGSLTEIDSGTASFMPIGWIGHRFIYKVHRNQIADFQPGQEALKSYDAEAKKLTKLDETSAAGKDVSYENYVKEYFGEIYLFNNEVVYAKNWEPRRGYGNHNQQATLNSIKGTGASKRVLKSFSRNPASYNSGGSVTISLQLYKPDTISIRFDDSVTVLYFNYSGESVQEAKGITDMSFYEHPTYFQSPNGLRTAWYELLDGKDTFLVGDSSGKNATQAAQLKGFDTYGWFDDNYLLVSKAGNQLHVIPADGLDSNRTPLKIADYYVY